MTAAKSIYRSAYVFMVISFTCVSAQAQAPTDIITKLIATGDDGRLGEYVESLNDTARNVQDEFFSDAGVDPSGHQLKVTAAAVDDCLYSQSISNLDDAIRACNASNSGYQFNLIMIVSFEKDGNVTQRVIPYDMALLRSASDKSFARHHYFEHKELASVSADERQLIRTLFVIGFLNTLWDELKDKDVLSIDEKRLLNAGFNDYKPAIMLLCSGEIGLNATRCGAIRDQILALYDPVMAKVK